MARRRPSLASHPDLGAAGEATPEHLHAGVDRFDFAGRDQCCVHVLAHVPNLSVAADVRAGAPHDDGDVLVLKRLYQRSDERPTTRVGDASSYSHGLQTIIAAGHDEA